MAEPKSMNFAGIELSESAASTLTEASMLTGTDPYNKRAMFIHQIECQMPLPADLPSTGAIETTQFAISRRSGLAAIPTIDDPDCIYTIARNLKAGVATYLPLVDYFEGHPQVHSFVPAQIVVAQEVYLYVKSTNSATAMGVYARIGYTYGTVKIEEILAAFQRLTT